MSIVKSAVDTYLAYRFVKLLVTPWENTEAYKLGVIDDDGKVLKSRRQRKTAESETQMLAQLCPTKQRSSISVF